MPTQALTEDVDPIELLRAALTQIDRREGYEIRLLAAVMTCAGWLRGVDTRSGGNFQLPQIALLPMLFFIAQMRRAEGWCWISVELTVFSY